jgi:hypothetical protein
MEKNKTIEFSICTIKGNCCISISLFLLQKLTKIFKCNKNGNLLSQQIADDEYFRKLEIVSRDLIKVCPQSYKSMQFLKNIPINETFIIMLGNAIEDTSLNKYTEINKKIYEINGIEYPIIGGKIADFYTIYYWGNQKAYIGEPDKNKRICRFCGKTSSSNITFKNKSHAISESLGNKLLFCNEECDSCNASFSSIENDFFNIHHPFISLYKMRGKNGIQNLKGKNLEIDNKHKNGLISIKSDTLPSNISNDLHFSFSEGCLKYTNQNIYRCLCKFAISLIDGKYLTRLSDTILWIRQKKTIDSLPAVWKRSCSIHNQPMLGLYIKKENIEKKIPEFVVRFFVLNIEYLFVFPIIDSVPVIFTESTKKELQEIFTLSEFEEIDLSSDEKKEMQLSFNIEFPKDSELIDINKSEYENLSEEERIAKYPNASGFLLIDDSKS